MTLNLDKSAWKRVRFGDVADRSRTQVDPAADRVERYVAGGHFDDGSLEVIRHGDPNDGGMGSTFKYLFRPGQVLYVSASWYLRKVGVATFEGVVADKTYVIETRDSEILNQRFLPWLLLSDGLHEYAAAQSTGSMNARLLWSTLSNYEFDLPPLDEQKRIADLLWALERHRQAVLVARGRSAQVRASWRDTVFGTPEVTARLDERADVILGRQRAPQHATGDHMRDYLRSANIGNGRVVLEGIKQMNFTPAEQEKFRLLPGDVLVSEGTASPRELGASAMWNPSDPDEEMYFQKTLLRLRAREDKSTPVLLREWAQWAQESGAFVRVATGTGILHISGVRCAAMPFPVLTAAESEALEVRAGKLSDAALAIQTELEHLEALYAELAGEIFGGQ